MKKYYSTFYVLFISLYIAGRFCLISSFSFENQYLRDIKDCVLPRALVIKTSVAIQNEKIISADFRKKAILKCYSSNMLPANLVPVNKAGLKYLVYTGSYTDPPDIA